MLFDGITWVARGNVADDELTRLVISGETRVVAENYDGFFTPVVYLRNEKNEKTVVPLWKSAATFAPRVARISKEELGENRRYTRFFVSWVDGYGMESPISEPSRVNTDFADNPGGVENVSGAYDMDLEYNDGDTIRLWTSLSGMGSDLNPAKKVRIYKVVTGTEEGRIQFIKEVAYADLAEMDYPQVDFTVKDEDAGEILPNIEAIPKDLYCIQAVPGNFYCGIAKSLPKTVCFSDVDLIYSWPVAYRYDVEDNPVALAVTGNTVFVLTNGSPYVLTGTLPESMTVTKLGSPAACVSQRGVCVYRNSVYFASTAGLMCIGSGSDGTVCQNLTDKIFTKRQWQEYNPSSCIMGQHDGALHLFFTLPDGAHKGLVIDLTENASVAVTTHDEHAKCLCVDDATGKMYYIREGE